MSPLYSRMARHHRSLAAFITVLIALSISYLSLDSHDGTRVISGSDKIQHAVAYFALTAPMTVWFGKKRWLWALAAAIGHGLLMEYLQGILDTGRTPSCLDAVANAVGAAAGCLAAWQLKKSRSDA